MAKYQRTASTIIHHPEKLAAGDWRRLLPPGTEVFEYPENSATARAITNIARYTPEQALALQRACSQIVDDAARRRQARKERHAAAT